METIKNSLLGTNFVISKGNNKYDAFIFKQRVLARFET